MIARLHRNSRRTTRRRSDRLLRSVVWCMLGAFLTLFILLIVAVVHIK